MSNSPFFWQKTSLKLGKRHTYAKFASKDNYPQEKMGALVVLPSERWGLG